MDEICSIIYKKFMYVHIYWDEHAARQILDLFTSKFLYFTWVDNATLPPSHLRSSPY